MVETSVLNAVMDWNDKVEMVELYHDPRKMSEFKSFVLGRIGGFDAQAWDMLITMIRIDPDYIQEHYDFFDTLMPYLNDFMLQVKNMPFALRIRCNALAVLVSS